MVYEKEIRDIRHAVHRIQTRKLYLYKKWHEMDAKLSHFRNELEKTLELARG